MTLQPPPTAKIFIHKILPVNDDVVRQDANVVRDFYRRLFVPIHKVHGKELVTELELIAKC